MSDRNLPPVPLQSRVIDATGIVTSPWGAFFRQLYFRAGGSAASTNLELGASLTSPSTTQFTIVNSQAVFADITGLSFSGSSYRSFEADLQIYRYTTGGGGAELSARVKLLGAYKSAAGSWEMNQMGAGDEIQDYGFGGLIFQITAAGQVQYKSHNQGGTPSVSKLKYSFTTMGVET